ncbi:MAG TPA: HAMP domain-containing histidine kinase [Caldithrix abyssi]|uniref:histidine kinase n=1 Tax=Caldithrix abyssi TaxID=187145 RepID=A0A7V5PMQ6_CALAY|nr:HAMP domain-containing histidine kinase [Caldithrix abyssi]
MTEQELKEIEIKYLGDVNVGLRQYRRLYEKGLDLIKKEPHPKKLLLSILDDYQKRLESMPAVDLSVTNLDTLDEDTREKVKSLILFGTQAVLVKENSDIQKNLREVNQNYRDLLSVISHEFKNSLTSIYGYNRIIRKRIENGKTENVAELSDNIDRLTRNLFGLVETLLSMALIEEGKLQVDRKIFDLIEDALNPVLQELSGRLEQKGMEVEVKTPEEKNIYYGDEKLFQLVFRNLIQNAIQYGKPNTKIEFKITRLTDALQISIFNQGSGLAKRNLNHIFEKFSRFHDTNDRTNVGIGLFAVRNIIEMHKGTIQADSETGQWMRFTIKLPMDF